MVNLLKEKFVMLIINRLDIVDVCILIEGVVEKVCEIGVFMCIVIVDEFGNLIVFECMDGGKIISVIIVQDKVFIVVVVKKVIYDYNKVNVLGSLVFGIYIEVGGCFSLVGGGLLVIVNGEVVGGIGLSFGIF